MSPGASPASVHHAAGRGSFIGPRFFNGGLAIDQILIGIAFFFPFRIAFKSRFEENDQRSFSAIAAVNS